MVWVTPSDQGPNERYGPARISYRICEGVLRHRGQVFFFAPPPPNFAKNKKLTNAVQHDQQNDAIKQTSNK